MTIQSGQVYVMVKRWSREDPVLKSTCGTITCGYPHEIGTDISNVVGHLCPGSVVVILGKKKQVREHILALVSYSKTLKWIGGLTPTYSVDSFVVVCILVNGWLHRAIEDEMQHVVPRHCFERVKG